MRSELMVLLFTLAVSYGCRQNSGPHDEETGSEPTGHAGGAHASGGSDAPAVYESRGTVLWFEQGRIYLNHEAMPGFMDAMAMGFDVRDPALLEGIEPGASVAFRVIVENDSFYVDQIHAVE